MSGRTKWPLPQPTSALRGGPVALTFESWQKAKAGIGAPEVVKLFQTHGAYAVKPHRNSRGVVWNNRAFWWSGKGYYRAGTAGGDRRPLQVLIYEQVTGQAVKRGYEIFFRDRDRHNFAIENMELMTKAALHKRTIEIGEFVQPTPEERSAGRQRMLTRKARQNTALLLQRFESKADHGNNELIKCLGDARKAGQRAKQSAYKKRWYQERKARQRAESRAEGGANQ